MSMASETEECSSLKERDHRELHKNRIVTLGAANQRVMKQDKSFGLDI